MLLIIFLLVTLEQSDGKGDGNAGFEKSGKISNRKSVLKGKFGGNP